MQSSRQSNEVIGPVVNIFFPNFGTLQVMAYGWLRYPSLYNWLH